MGALPHPGTHPRSTSPATRHPATGKPVNLAHRNHKNISGTLPSGTTTPTSPAPASSNSPPTSSTPALTTSSPAPTGQPQRRDRAGVTSCCIRKSGLHLHIWCGPLGLRLVGRPADGRPGLGYPSSHRGSGVPQYRAPAICRVVQLHRDPDFCLLYGHPVGVREGASRGAAVARIAAGTGRRRFLCARRHWP